MWAAGPKALGRRAAALGPASASAGADSNGFAVPAAKCPIGRATAGADGGADGGWESDDCGCGGAMGSGSGAPPAADGGVDATKGPK